MTIAITGANGQLGRLVLTALAERVPSTRITALVRDPAKAEVPVGVAVRAADYDQPESLLPALHGIESLLLISSNAIGRRIAQHRQLIDAAVQAKVRHIAYTSLLHADRSPLSLAEEHRATEAALRESGLSYTVLRNGWYSENYTGSIASVLAHGAYVNCAGEARISAAARADYAEAAAVVLSQPGHEGKIYELAGDQAFTLSELAAEISRQSGRDIPYRDVPEAEFAGLLLAAGLPQLYADGIASWSTAARDDALFDDRRQLSQLIGRPTTSLAKVVAQALG